MMIMWAALFVLAAFSVGVSGYAIKNRNKLEQLETVIASKLQQLSCEIDAVNSGAVGVGQQVIQIEKKLNLTISEQERLQLSAEHQPYGQAEAQAEQGVNAEQLTERFGLSESEAQLMSMMQKRTMSH